MDKMKIPKAGIVRRPRELDAFCRKVVMGLLDLAEDAIKANARTKDLETELAEVKVTLAEIVTEPEELTQSEPETETQEEPKK